MLGLSHCLSLKLPGMRVAEPEFEGPLDALASKVLSAFATFRLFTTEDECVNVRRAADSAAQDIGTLTNGSFDDASFNDFVDGGSGYVVTAHDQAGTNDAVQAAEGSQPRLNLTAIGGKPALDFASGNYLGTGSFSNGIGTGDFEFWCLFKPTTLSGSRALFGGASDRILFHCSQVGNARLGYWNVSFGAGFVSFDSTLNEGTTYLARFYRSGGVMSCEVNGVPETSTHAFTQSVPTDASFGLGTEQAGSSSMPFVGGMMLAILFDQGLTSGEAAALTGRLKEMGGIT